MSFVADESTALLHNNNNIDIGNGTNGSSFIVHVSKDPADYEPYAFCAADFSFALSLEELLPYKDDPWWQFARRLMFASFWLVLLLAFLGACALSYVQSNHCESVTNFKSSTAVTTSSVGVGDFSLSPTVLSSTLQMTT